MSTTYFIACKKCHVGVAVASWGLGGFQFWRGEPECMKALHKLMEEHTIGEHDIGVITEHDTYDDDLFFEIEWKRGELGAASSEGSK